MGKKLAIRGHSTRGKEVIELLEMMGGKNIHKHDGEANMYSYYLFDYAILSDRLSITEDDDFEIFTLQEFLEKFPYKVGDKVNYPCKGCVKTITSMKWDSYLNTVSYKLDNKIYTRIEQLKVVNDLPYKESDDMKFSDSKCERTHEDVIFDSIIWHLRNSVNNGKQNLSGGECEKYFREVVKKNNENKMKNVLAELLEHIKNTSKEELEKEFNELEEWSHIGPTVDEFMTFCECVNKKPVYPTTYEECCDMLNANEFVGYELKINFPKLINARNAYWKIAGEQMGLDKPWEPKFGKYIHYSINFYFYQDSFVLHKGEYSSSDNCILVFPSEEMRDAFYENFKDLIEQCKELL